MDCHGSDRSQEPLPSAGNRASGRGFRRSYRGRRGIGALGPQGALGAGRVQRSAAYQCTPRISEAKAICSPLGSASPLAALLPPLAAAESGNSSNAVFITTS